MQKVTAAMLILVLWGALALGPVEVTRGSDELMALSGTVWVTNRSLHNIARFDAATGVLRGVAAVERAPIGIVIPAGTGKSVHLERGL